MMRKNFFLTVVLLVGFWVVLGTAQAQFFFLESPLVGEKAPAFELKDLRSISQDFTSLSKDKNTILFFWATWCPHCREQLKELDRRMAELKTAGIQLFLVDLGEEKGIVENYLDKSKLDVLVLLDKEGLVSENYKVLGIPTFVFVDKGGVVRTVEHALPENLKASFCAPSEKC